MEESFQGAATVYHDGKIIIGPLAGTLEITREESGELFGWSIESTRTLGARASVQALRMAGAWEYVDITFCTEAGALYSGQAQVVPEFPVSGAFRLQLFSEQAINSTPKPEAETTPV